MAWLRICVAVWFLASVSARAQSTVPLGQFSASLLRPIPEGGMVEDPWPSKKLWSGAALVDYAYRPLVVDTHCGAGSTIDCGLVGSDVAVRTAIGALHLMGGWSPRQWVRLALVAPILVGSGDALPFVDGGVPNYSISKGSAGALGDVRLQGKFAILRSRDGSMGLGAGAYVTAPFARLSADYNYLGDRFPIVGGHAIGGWTRGSSSVAVNLGGQWRHVERLIESDVGPQMTYGASYRHQITQIFGAGAELTGATAFGLHDDQLEARAHAQAKISNFDLIAGLGAGIVRGPGVPVFRLFAGGSWSPPERVDTDHDGVLDSHDGCPANKEDPDQFQDQDGCPEPDNDEDGRMDKVDQCPREPEDVDGYEDDDGCPEPDNDHDGIPDGYDSCPATPEDLDGDRDDDGCVDQDRDRDGVDDSADPCPDKPEDTDGLADTDGCPEEDADKDGIKDDNDECPEEPEDHKGKLRRDGCPLPAETSGQESRKSSKNPGVSGESNTVGNH